MAKVKICGINDAGIACRAESLGADYLGFIFAEGSPRCVSPGKAAEIVAALRGTARRVGVFTGGTACEILQVARAVPLDGANTVEWNGSRWSLVTTAPDGSVSAESRVLAGGTKVSVGGMSYTVHPFHPTYVD